MCEVCGGRLMLLGQLGNREHSRCQDCGAECSRELGEDDEAAEAVPVETEGLGQ